MNYKIQLIIPTYNHPETLEWSIKSAQEQTVDSVRIVIIGDGVNDSTRDIVQKFMLEDSRVHFLDNSKAQRHGEEYRHEAISKFDDPLVAYLGDDDLLFKNHLEVLVDEMGERCFVNSFPTIIRPDGSIFTAPTQISDRRYVEWHINDEKRNTISLTGVMHTRDFYLKLPVGWTPAPKSDYSDHYMWKKFFAHPEFNGITSRFATTAKLASDLRTHMSPHDRQIEISRFWDEMQSPDFQIHWNSKVSQSVLNTAQELQLGLTYVQSQNQALTRDLELKVDELNENLEISRTNYARILESRSWKLMSLPRKINLVFKRFLNRH